MTGLREMIRNELARREHDGDKWPTLCFLVYDAHPAVQTDVEAATKAIIEQAERGNGDDPVYIPAPFPRP